MSTWLSPGYRTRGEGDCHPRIGDVEVDVADVLADQADARSDELLFALRERLQWLPALLRRDVRAERRRLLEQGAVRRKGPLVRRVRSTRQFGGYRQH